MADQSFYRRMALVCAQIPYGHVATYGQIALLCGKPRNSRQVGYGLKHDLAGMDVPAHRVVNSKGLLSGARYFDTNDMQKIRLEEEGVEVLWTPEGWQVDLKRFGWKNTMDDALFLEAAFRQADLVQKDTDVTIRPAQLDDVKRLAAIEAQCFPASEAASYEQIFARFKAFPENFLVAETDGLVIGFINGGSTDAPYLPDAFYHDTSLHDPTGTWQTVFGLNVLPEYRKQGIAAKLIESFLDLARGRQKAGVILTCKAKLIHYYEKFGFVNYGVADSSHGGAVWYDMRCIF